MRIWLFIKDLVNMYKFKPILKTLVWGTESWVLSGVRGSESVVEEGPQAGKKITDIYPGTFPLLIKFIDAKRDLSIQVHPDDELARKRHNSKGKTEMWYIIDAAPQAHLISGLKKSITPEDYVRFVEENKITDVLQDYKVSSGDVFFLPAGRIHAIGGGCYLAEIQETSDITYRIYDYGRLGLDGKPRQLHTELAKDAIDYSVLPDYRTHYEPKKDALVNLVTCKHFTTDLLELDRPFDMSVKKCGEFLVVIQMKGSSVLKTASEQITLMPGECALILSSEEDNLQIIPSKEGSSILTTHC